MYLVNVHVKAASFHLIGHFDGFDNVHVVGERYNVHPFDICLGERVDALRMKNRHGLFHLHHGDVSFLNKQTNECDQFNLLLVIHLRPQPLQQGFLVELLQDSFLPRLFHQFDLVNKQILERLEPSCIHKTQYLLNAVESIHGYSVGVRVFSSTMLVDVQGAP